MIWREILVYDEILSKRCQHRVEVFPNQCWILQHSLPRQAIIVVEATRLKWTHWLQNYLFPTNWTKVENKCPKKNTKNAYKISAKNWIISTPPIGNSRTTVAWNSKCWNSLYLVDPVVLNLILWEPKKSWSRKISLWNMCKKCEMLADKTWVKWRLPMSIFKCLATVLKVDPNPYFCSLRTTGTCSIAEKELKRYLRNSRVPNL